MIDWSKPVQTDHEDPWPGRVLCTDAPGERPVAILVGNTIYRASIEGGTGRGFWFVNVRQKHVCWANIYETVDGSRKAYLFDSVSKAHRAGGRYRVACIRIEFEEGEGLKDSDNYEQKTSE